MPYDELLADRIRVILKRRRGFIERKLFGGVGFLLNGNLCVCVWKEFLIVRVGEAGYLAALKSPFVREFDVTGRPMKGWVMVEPPGVTDDDDLSAWIEKAIAFVRTLPRKQSVDRSVRRSFRQ